MNTDTSSISYNVCGASDCTNYILNSRRFLQTLYLQERIKQIIQSTHCASECMPETAVQWSRGSSGSRLPWWLDNGDVTLYFSLFMMFSDNLQRVGFSRHVYWLEELPFSSSQGKWAPKNHHIESEEVLWTVCLYLCPLECLSQNFS